MARTDPLPPFSAPLATAMSDLSAVPANDPFFDLSRLLARLEQNLLRADGDQWRRLVGDEFQRLQARFDVAAAHTLLTRVEQAAVGDGSGKMQTPAQGQARRPLWQADLARRRVLVERLQERLENVEEEARALAALGKEDDEDEEDEPAEVDASLADVVRFERAEVREESKAAKESEGPEEPEESDKLEAPSEERLPDKREKPQPTSATQPKRARRRRTAQPPETTETPTPHERVVARTTGTDAAQRATLLERQGGQDDNVVAEEAALDDHRREQEALSEDILRLATALKDKSLATARLLEDDRDVVDRVGEGLHTTNETLTAASRSMAVLSRMTEGKGWIGRMVLYALVYGLMALLVLLFLSVPKLR